MLTITTRPNEICYTANPIAYVVRTSVDLATSGLRINAIVNFWDDVDGSSSELLSTVGFPDEDGNVLFQFDKILFTLMDQYDLPAYSQSAITICKNAHKRMQVTFSEQTDDGITDTKTAPSVDLIKGGTPFELFTTQADLFSNLSAFRTLMPNGKYVSPLQQDYLYFLAADNYTGITTKFIVKRTDGTSESFTGVPLPDLSKYEMVCIPVGPGQIFSSDFRSLIQSYSFQLFIGTQELSEQRTFIIDNTYYEESRLIAFGNSLGAVDFIFFTGLSNLTDAYTQSTANIYVPYNYNLKYGQRKTFEHLKQNKIHASTGYKLEEEIDLVQSELLLADGKWEDVYGKFVPLIIDTTNVVKKSARQRLFALELDYEYSFVNKVTGAPVIPKPPTNSGLDEYDGDPVGGEIPIQATKMITVLQELRVATQSAKIYDVVQQPVDGDTIIASFAQPDGSGADYSLTFRDSPHVMFVDVQIGASLAETTTNLLNAVSILANAPWYIADQTGCTSTQLRLSCTPGGPFDGAAGINSAGLSNFGAIIVSPLGNVSGGVDGDEIRFPQVGAVFVIRTTPVDPVFDIQSYPTSMFNQADAIALQLNAWIESGNKTLSGAESTAFRLGPSVAITAGSDFPGAAGNTLVINTSDDAYIGPSGGFSGGSG